MEIKIKSTMKYHYVTSRMTKIKIMIKPNAGEDAEKWDNSYTLVGT